jgi:hypothetical protein
MVAFTVARAPQPIEIQAFQAQGAQVADNRNVLLQAAMDWGASYILWADVDHVFPADALLRLLSLGLDIVGVNYARRALPTGPTAHYGDDRGFVYTTEEKARAGEVEEVGSLGFGLLLTSAAALERMRTFGESKPDYPSYWPPFAWRDAGEDVIFCRKAREAGLKVHVDHGLSWHVEHLTEMPLSIADTLRDRAAFGTRTSTNAGCADADTVSAPAGAD